jgi:uncharacterized protein
MVILAQQTFFHREQEIADLTRLTRREDRPALVLVYGRRRVGKSTLLREWARRSGFPTFYWESPRGNADFVLNSFMTELYTWAGEPVIESRSSVASWADAFRALRRVIGARRVAVILDEFPWAIESQRALPSQLKTAWDTVFADSRILMFISGSHISAMEQLLLSDAPLFGRMTGKLHVPPFEFAETDSFLRRYTLEKRLAVYSILGGVPDYLQRWDDRVGLMPNISEIFLSNLSPYRNEHLVLVSDVLRRDSPDYETVLNVVGSGKSDSADIAAFSAVPTNRTANVLRTLTELRLIERRIRASVPVDKHQDARHARYFLVDPFLQFYYRFVAPNRSKIALGLEEALTRIFAEQLRGYVGLAFEHLCRRWLLAQAQAGTLELAPDYIGSDWSGAQYQADAVAVNWRERQLLVGEAKWTDSKVDRAVLAQLDTTTGAVLEKIRLAVAKDKRALPWRTTGVIFSRHGASAGLKATLATRPDIRVVTFEQVAGDLAQRPVRPLRG